MLKDIERLSVNLAFVSSVREVLLQTEEDMFLNKLCHFHRNKHLIEQNSEGTINI